MWIANTIPPEEPEFGLMCAVCSRTSAAEPLGVIGSGQEPRRTWSQNERNHEEEGKEGP